MREKLYWYLVSLADKVSDIAFSNKSRIWQLVFVFVANWIDGIALHIMTDEMRNRPATVCYEKNPPNRLG